MSPLQVIGTLADLYIIVIIADVVLSWLINFQIINASNDIVRTVHTFTYKLTNPVYLKIRKIIPPIGGLDLSPIFLILGVQLRVWLLWRLFGGILG